ncbi:MAG: porin [Pirellulales bacterium]
MRVPSWLIIVALLWSGANSASAQLRLDDAELAASAEEFRELMPDEPTSLVESLVDGPANADAQKSLEQRVQLLEKELQKQQEAAAKKKEADALKPSFQIGGQLQVDYLWIGQDAANRASVGDAQNMVDFRRARITGRGEAFDVIEYAMGFDFALAGRPTFLDIWGGVRDLPYLGHVRAGHYFEPFSLERMTQNSRNTFMERSLADTFAPSRNTGLEAYDALGEEERASYQIGWFASNSDVFGDEFADVGGQAVTARLTWLPWWVDDGRGFWHVGGAYSYRTPPNQQWAFGSFPEARAGNPLPPGIPLFVNTGIIANNDHQLFGLETALVYGPLYIQSEFMATSVNQIGGPDLFFHGAYVNASYFLTGEHRTYNKLFGIIDRVFPTENFFRVRTEDGAICNGKGAWEVAARYSYVDLTDANIQGGTLRNVTLGLTWHLTAFTRVKWEVIQTDLDRAPVGKSQATIAGMRFDFEF